MLAMAKCFISSRIISIETENLWTQCLQANENISKVRLSDYRFNSHCPFSQQDVTLLLSSFPRNLRFVLADKRPNDWTPYKLADLHYNNHSHTPCDLLATTLTCYEVFLKDAIVRNSFLQIV